MYAKTLNRIHITGDMVTKTPNRISIGIKTTGERVEKCAFFNPIAEIGM